jgi:hypothetical protein
LAGAPSAALDERGAILVAYRVRSAAGRGGSTVIARAALPGASDAARLTRIAELPKARFAAESLERPALVRTDGGWRLYVSCATPGSKHWRIDALDASTPEGLADAEARTVLPGDDHTGVKDPVIRRDERGWHAWICCHPLDDPGEEDRMTTAYATSLDGLAWEWHGTVLTGRAGEWDARGARVTSILPDGGAAYDGRATKEENFSERTGLATPHGDRLVATGQAICDARYLEALALPDGTLQLFYEVPLPDGSHELRTRNVTTLRSPA